MEGNKSLNEKYKPLSGEFIYKNVLHFSWTSIDIIKRIEDDDIFRPSDTIVATYPKSGTTVLQELVWLISNDVNIQKSRAVNITIRYPFLESDYVIHFPSYCVNTIPLNIIDRIKGPRFFKTHLLYRNLEKQICKNPGLKIATCFRNPKDTAVSYYHFYKNLPEFGPFTGTWEDFFEMWCDGWISGGDWLDVITEWWNQRHRENIKIIFYEDIVKKREQVVKELCVFLGKKINEEDVSKIVEHTSFSSMKDNPSTNYEAEIISNETFTFMRKGQIGDWKNYFTAKQSEVFDQKYDSVLRACGLEFQYE